jgi:hypothetical protein
VAFGEALRDGSQLFGGHPVLLAHHLGQHMTKIEANFCMTHGELLEKSDETEYTMAEQPPGWLSGRAGLS